MITVLDASALLALMRNEHGAALVHARLAGAMISTVNLAEVAAVLARGNSAEEVRLVLGGIVAEAVPPDEETAIEAGLLRSITDRAGLSLGDRFCIALGRRLSATVLTADRAWADLAAELGLDVELIR